MKLRIASLAAVLALALAPTVGATTYKMVSDQALADRAAAVAEVRVAAVEPAPTGGTPSTDYLVEVERLVKGYLPGSTVVVRVPGGIRPDGVGLKIWGAPAFAEGERALLFLRPNQDGTYRTVHLMLGAFHERVKGGRRIVLRDLSEAKEVRSGAGGGQELREGTDVERDLAGFSRWVKDRAEGVERPADYLVGQVGDAGPLGQAIAPFTFLTYDDGKAIRWFRFDSGGSVSWRVNQTGQPGLGLDRTIAAFRTALAAWVDDPATNIGLNYVGTTTASGGLDRDDNVNTILFDDPGRSSHVDDSFSCSEGGVIAAGGPFFFLSTRDYRGVRYHEAVEADIVTNDGTECFFRDNPRVAEEVFAHELGHTLGLGHSRDPGALMWANAHDDGRGARLAADDRAAVATLYGNGTVPPPPSGGPAAPTNLAARILSPTQVVLTWSDNATDEDQYLVERKRVGGSFRQILALPANTTSATVAGLTPGKTFVFRVRARRGNSFSAFSNSFRLTMPAVVTTPPQAPTELRAVALSPTQVRLSWRDNSNNETRFAIQQSTAGGAFRLVANATADRVRFTVGGLVPGTRYTFRIRAANAAGASRFTAAVSVTTPLASTTP